MFSTSMVLTSSSELKPVECGPVAHVMCEFVVVATVFEFLCKFRILIDTGLLAKLI